MEIQQNGQARNGSPVGDLHLCPTRIDRTPVLMAHKVTTSLCQDRQRGQYHKCFTCAWNNVWIAAHGEPEQAAGVERRSFIRAG